MMTNKQERRIRYINPPSNCDICKEKIENTFIDGKTRRGGRWANMCSDCFADNGVGIGLGEGQVYERKTIEDEEVFIKIAG